MASGLFIGAERVFNARNLSPERVAQTFVPPDGFNDLCQESNAVIMGPRGSGKTTLLKMLTPRAIAEWRRGGPSEIQSFLPFDAIYIPSDIHWEEQLRAFSYGLRGTDDESPLERAFSQAAVTVNVLISVFDSMIDVARLYDLEEKRPAVDFLRIILDAWRLGTTPPLAGAIREALEARFNDLFLLFRRLAYEGQIDQRAEQLPEWAFLDYMPATRVACTAFEHTFPSRSHRKWALCFDELELAPQWLQDRLFQELRSTDQRFLLKLSTSPLPVVKTQEIAAADSEDYVILRLWPHAKKASREFSRRLASQIVASRLGVEVTPEQLLGRSTIAASDETSYSAGGSDWSVFKELARRDSTFRTLLIGKGVDPADPWTDKKRVRDEVLRKAKPLAHFRVAWLTGHHEAGKRKVRTRKRPGLYHGIEDVLDIADGNPRWLITILRELLNTWESDVSKSLPMNAKAQEAVLSRTSKLFLGFLKTLPDRRSHGSIGMTIDELVETLGIAFEDFVLKRPFTLNPFGTVRVDAKLPSPLVKSLRWAAEQGALVVMDPPDRGLDWKIEGRRLRLTYLLAPQFRLPLRAYKEKALTQCLRAGGLPAIRLQQLELGYD